MELLTTNEAAKLVKLCSRSVRLPVAAGKIGAIRVGMKGGRMYFTPEDIEAYLESCRSYGSRRASNLRARRQRLP
jgi:excisionase family DNA binding protein